MFQNYLAPTILSTRYRLAVPTVLELSASGVNDRVFAVNNTTIRGFLTKVDSVSSDFLLNISFTSNIPTSSAVYAVSWAGSGSPVGESFDQFDVVPIPFTMIGCCNLSVHVPRADLSGDESQYVGFIVLGDVSDFNISGIIRVHNQDLQFLQPSK